MRMAEQAAIGIDIGGTKIAVGGVFANGRLERLTRIPTADATLADLARVATRVAEQLDAEIAGARSWTPTGTSARASAFPGARRS
jgi:predicted NBD/HSP70 family sugar kinase